MALTVTFSKKNIFRYAPEEGVYQILGLYRFWFSQAVRHIYTQRQLQKYTSEDTKSTNSNKLNVRYSLKVNRSRLEQLILYISTSWTIPLTKKGKGVQ